MKEILKYGVILSVICAIAAGLLAEVYSLTRPKIAEQARIELEASLRQVIPEAIRFEEVKSKEETLYFKGYNSKGSLVGFAFTVQAKGYSSVIDTMVALASDGTVMAIKVISQSETPGLGSRVGEESFAGQFAKKQTRDISGVEAISGATISSRAVIDSVARKSEEIKKILR